MFDLFDLHCDTLYECYKNGYNLRNDKLAVSIQNLQNFEKHCQIFAIWINDNLKNPYALYMQILNDAIYNFQSNAKDIVMCKTKSEVKDTLEQNKSVAFLSVEGGALIENEPARVEQINSDGVKIITLTWNKGNGLAGGAKSYGKLTKLGNDVIRRMNRLNMAVDLSHLNSKSFYSCITHADNVLATHSDCSAVNKHKRNLTDEQLKLIKAKNGIVGICFYPEFLGDGDVYDKVYSNVSHMLDLGLENCLSIGSDFDGATMSPKLKNPADIEKLHEFLCDKGIDSLTLKKLFFNNAYKFYDKLLTNT